MEEKISISVILPVSKNLFRDFKEFFDKSIKSVQSQSLKPIELIVVYQNETELSTIVNEYDYGDLNVNKLIWNEEPNFCAQVNHGIKNSKGEWFSILEFDDEYSSIWFKNVKKYMDFYPEVKGFLPVVVDTDNKNAFAGFTNEATFAANFTMEMGYLTNDILHNYQNFQTSGGVFKKETFEEFGGLKSSMKLTFIYEYLLRLTYNSVTIMTIPKIGYKHTNMREHSIFWEYKNGINELKEDEVKFWIQTAKKEYFFSEDRNIKYESQNS
jgi:glycosyltransferase involved in cell wall biosynthesis